MILKKNRKEQWGIPYQGSKTKIISEIAKCFPNAENFYDLFGGGFSASHYMLVRRKNSYKQFHYNELRPGLPDLIKDAINGKYSYKNFKPEWISRERFFAEKESNPYIKIIWSFGNNGNNYLFGEDLEQPKRSMHQAVVFDEFDDWFIETFKISKWPDGLKTIVGKRLFLRKLVSSINRNDLQQLERLEQLEQLEQLERLERLEQKILFTNLDYREVNIKPNSVIYCDIPYKGTGDYGNSFSHDDFFNWAADNKEPVFISEYSIDDKRFHLIKSIKHRTTFSQTENNEVKERLYCNDAAMIVLKKHLGLIKKTKLRKNK